MSALKDPAAPKLNKTKAPKVVLVLGAGGARGIAHIGVLEVLQEAGIPIDLIIGCSMGGLIGAFYADGHEPAHILERAVTIMPQRATYQAFGLPYFVQGFSGGGFFTTHALRSRLSKELKAQTFEELKIPLAVVATDLHEGSLTTFDKGPLLDPLCASAAIPGFFQAVEINNRSYVDGGVITELPVYTAEGVGAKVIIGSNVKGWIDIATKGDIDNVPMRSYHIMRHRFDEVEEARAHVMIRPDLSGVMNVIFSDPNIMQEVYERGKKSAKAQLPHIEELLAKADVA